MQEIKQKLGFDAKNAIDNLEALSKKLIIVNTHLEKMNNLMKATGLSKITKKFNELDRSAGKSSGKIRRFLQSFTGINPITAGFRVLSSVFREAIVEATKFGLKVAEIQTIGGKMEKNNDQITASVMRLSSAFGIAATDVAEGLYQTLSNQVVKASKATDFLASSLKLAKVTAASSGDAINALSSVLNTYKERAGGAAEASDVLFKMVEFGRLRLNEVGNILGRVLPLTSQMGVSFKETAAAIAVMTRQGVKADTAVTQLRAVMQKIIKPTESMKKLFRSWGVKDGPDAIKTFGGLYNMLRKMSREVGGSNAEMAKYFRRVRAIVGQMSLLNDNGELMIQTMKEMEKATGATNDAWAEFQKTDAQKLIQSWIEFKNAIIETGRAMSGALSVLVDWAKYIAIVADKGVKAIQRMVDPLANQQQQLQGLSDYWANLPELIIKPAKVLSKEYKKAASDALQALLPLKKEFFRITDAMQASADRMVNIASDTVGEIADNYKTIISDLKKVIDDLPKQAKKARDDIGKINASAEKRDFDRRLRNAKSEYERRTILANEFNKLQNKLTALTYKGNLTKEDREAAVKLHNQAISLANAQEIKATEDKRYQEANIWQARQRKNDEVAKRVQQIFIAQAEKKAYLAKEASKTLERDSKQVKELTKQIQDQLKIQSENALKRGPAARAAVESSRKTIDELKKQLAVYKIPDRARDFLKSLGVDPSGIDELNKSIQDGLSKNLTKLQLDLKSVQTQLLSKTFDIRVKLHEKQLREQAAVLKIPNAQEKDVFDLKAAVTAKAEQISIVTSDTEQKIKHIEKSLSGFAKEYDKIDTQIVTTTNLSKKSTRTFGDMFSVLYRRYTNALQGKTRGKNERERFVNVANEVRGITPEYVKIQNRLDGIHKRLLKHVHVEQGELDIVRQISSEYEKTGKITVAGKKAIDARANALEKERSAVDELIKLRKDLATPIQKDVLRQVLPESITKDLEDSAKAGKKAIEGQGVAAQNVKPKLQSNADTSHKIAQNSFSTVNAMNQFAVSAGNAQGPLGNVLQVVTQIRDTALEAANAVARTGGGGGGKATKTAKFGRFFAQGGRGTDVINAMLSPGEMVINSRSSQNFFSQLNAMNQGSQPVYREQGGPVTNVGDINVSVNGGDSSQQTVREIGRALRREIQRGTIKLR